jgi:PAS domain S-box-containing protein
MADNENQWGEWRRKIIGLGDESCRKNYYPELQKRLDDLKASQADLLTLFNSVTDAIFIHDFTGRVIEVNNAMLTMYQVSREEAVGYTIADYSGDTDALHLTEVMEKLGSSSEKLLFEWKARRPKDGVLFDVEVALQQIVWKNTPMVVAVVRDISSRKAAEQSRRELELQLAQIQKMDSIGRLAGGVAHDFNNMLQAIIGNCDLALEMVPRTSPVREFLEEIDKSARRSAELTRQLLAFARKQTIQPVALDMNDTVNGIIKMLRRLIGENIELVWKPGAELWPVLMDPSQVDQLLANLCVNSRDAIQSSGRISLETCNVTFDSLYASVHPECSPGDYVMLSVSDNGCGMDERVKSHLFEPFFTTKGVGKGTGLGLATVFGIVKQNNGVVNVYSELGCGTVFRVYFPRVLAKVEDRVAVQAVAPGGDETLLLVEDEEQVLTLSRRTLELRGYNVLSASTPEAAIALCQAHEGTIHLLVADVVMPRMNGRDLFMKLRELRPNLKCLYMSGYTSDIIADRGILSDGVLFLQKPFNALTLTRRVREALELSGSV